MPGSGRRNAGRLLRFFNAPEPPAEAFPELTVREREIVDLFAHGRTNTEIAGLLYLNPKSVRNHVSNVFAKLHVADRAQVIIRPRDAGPGRD